MPVEALIRIFESELRCITDETGRFPETETGGSLFGLWSDGGNPTIYLASRPAVGAVRAGTAFEQDVEFHRAMELLLIEHCGLQSVGLWHSHHQLGLPELSGGDVRRSMTSARRTGRRRSCDILAYFDRFEGPTATEVSVKPYVYRDAGRGEQVPTRFVLVPGTSPVRALLRRMPVPRAYRKALEPASHRNQTQHRLEESIRTTVWRSEDRHTVRRSSDPVSPQPVKRPARGTRYPIADPAIFIMELERLMGSVQMPVDVECVLELVSDEGPVHLRLAARHNTQIHDIDLGADGAELVALRHCVRDIDRAKPEEHVSPGAVFPARHVIAFAAETLRRRQSEE